MNSYLNLKKYEFESTKFMLLYIKSTYCNAVSIKIIPLGCSCGQFNLKF